MSERTPVRRCLVERGLPAILLYEVLSAYPFEDAFL